MPKPIRKELIYYLKKLRHHRRISKRLDTHFEVLFKNLSMRRLCKERNWVFQTARRLVERQTNWVPKANDAEMQKHVILMKDEL